MPSVIERVLGAKQTKASVPYERAISEMFAAVLLGSPRALEDARDRLDHVIRSTMGVAELLAATKHLKAFAKQHIPNVQAADQIALIAFREETPFDLPPQAIMHDVTFEEALDDLIARVPTTIEDPARRTYQEIARIYTEEGGAIAFVRSAEEEVTKAAKKVIEDAQVMGYTERQVGLELRRISVDSSPKNQELLALGQQANAWSEKYARMAFRTNASSAATQGQFRAAADEEVAGVIPAFMFKIADRTARPNHIPADGLVMAISDPDWAIIAPPLEWNCRCWLREMSRPMLRRGGFLKENGQIRKINIPSGAYPHPDFRPGRMRTTGGAPPLPGLESF